MWRQSIESNQKNTSNVHYCSNLPHSSIDLYASLAEPKYVTLGIQERSMLDIREDTLQALEHTLIG